MSYPGIPSVYDRKRSRFYALTANQVIVLDPSSGTQRVLVSDADAPRGPSSLNELSQTQINQVALSALGDALYIAASSDRVVRLNLDTELVEQRWSLPPAPPGTTRLLNAVLPSHGKDDEVYVAYAEITPGPSLSSTVEFWLTRVRGGMWDATRFRLSSLEGNARLLLKSDDSEIVLLGSSDTPVSGPVFRRVRIANGTMTRDGVQEATVYDPYSGWTGPAYVATGILFRAAIYDAATLVKSFDVPAAKSCSALADPAHVICVAYGGADHLLFVFDLVQRQTVKTWKSGLPVPTTGVGGPSPTGWVSEAGSSRVLVHYAWNLAKGLNATGLYSYTDPALN